MQKNEYYDKYASFFLQPKIADILSRTLKESDGAVKDKYNKALENQFKVRLARFDSALNESLSCGNGESLNVFAVEADKIYSADGASRTAACRLVNDYFYRLTESKGVFENYKIALDFIKKMIPSSHFKKECVDCCVKFTNKFDDAGNKEVADKFFAVAEGISPSDAGVRFRKFRLGLGCYTNDQFTRLDDRSYMKSGEGKSIFYDSYYSVERLFKLQNESYEKRLEKERRERECAEVAEAARLELERQKQAAKDAEARRKKQAAANRRAAVGRGFYIAAVALPLTLSLFFTLSNILFLCDVSPFNSFWLATYITVEKSKLAVARGGAIAATVFASIFTVTQIPFIVFAVQDKLCASWFRYETGHVVSFVFMILGCLFIGIMTIVDGVNWGKAVTGKDLYHKDYVPGGWLSNSEPEECVIYSNGCYMFVSNNSITDYYCCSDNINLVLPAEHHEKPINYFTFKGCTSLKSVIIPEGVTRIGSNAFSGCSNLESVTIPDSVTSIGSSAFSDCIGLKSITIPDSVTSIESSAFSGCTGLERITIPDGVTSIEYGTFSGCTGLERITIPDGVTIIDGYAFEYCTGLESVIIPLGVQHIENCAFYGCGTLSIYCEADEKPSGWGDSWNCYLIDYDNGGIPYYVPVTWNNGNGGGNDYDEQFKQPAVDSAQTKFSAVTGGEI